MAVLSPSAAAVFFEADGLLPATGPIELANGDPKQDQNEPADKHSCQQQKGRDPQSSGFSFHSGASGAENTYSERRGSVHEHQANKAERVLDLELPPYAEPQWCERSSSSARLCSICLAFPYCTKFAISEVRAEDRSACAAICALCWRSRLGSSST